MRGLLIALIFKLIRATFYRHEIGSYSHEDVIFEEKFDSALTCLHKSNFYGGKSIYERGICKIIKKDSSGAEITSNSITEAHIRSNCIEREWFQIDLIGYDISYSYSVVTTEDCKRKCLENEFCRFWVSIDNNVCHLKTSDSNRKVVTDSRKIISGNVCPIKDCKEIVEYNINYFRGDIRHVQLADVEDCKKECQEEVGCSFWTWDKVIKTCYLKSSNADKSHNLAYISGTICKT